MRQWLLILFFATNAYSEIGEISELRGNGEILRQAGGDKLLAELALDILSYDSVFTGNGRIAIEFIDESIIKLTEHSKIVIDEYIYDPDPSKSKLALNMASGTARFITGALGKIDKKNISIRTPSANIAIRGTDFTTTVDELGRSLVILLPDANGTTSGEIAVETWSGTEILNKPFQATMVSTFESRPTKAVVLGGITLGLIDNMLIINQPPEVTEAIEQQQTESKTELDKDFFEAGSKKKTESGGELDGIKLMGIVPGFDPVYQTYSFVEGEHLYLVHHGSNIFDIGLDKYAATYLSINTAGIIMEIEVNGAGDNTIIIFQSP